MEMSWVKKRGWWSWRTRRRRGLGLGLRVGMQEVVKEEWKQLEEVMVMRVWVVEWLVGGGRVVLGWRGRTVRCLVGWIV